jgi:hypothetical protein
VVYELGLEPDSDEAKEILRRNLASLEPEMFPDRDFGTGFIDRIRDFNERITERSPIDRISDLPVVDGRTIPIMRAPDEVLMERMIAGGEGVPGIATEPRPERLSAREKGEAPSFLPGMAGEEGTPLEELRQAGGQATSLADHFLGLGMMSDLIGVAAQKGVIGPALEILGGVGSLALDPGQVHRGEPREAPTGGPIDEALKTLISPITPITEQISKATSEAQEEFSAEELLEGDPTGFGRAAEFLSFGRPYISADRSFGTFPFRVRRTDNNMEEIVNVNIDGLDSPHAHLTSAGSQHTGIDAETMTFGSHTSDIQPGISNAVGFRAWVRFFRQFADDFPNIKTVHATRVHGLSHGPIVIDLQGVRAGKPVREVYSTPGRGPKDRKQREALEAVEEAENIRRLEEFQRRAEETFGAPGRGLEGSIKAALGDTTTASVDEIAEMLRSSSPEDITIVQANLQAAFNGHPSAMANIRVRLGLPGETDTAQARRALDFARGADLGDSPTPRTADDVMDAIDQGVAPITRPSDSFEARFWEGRISQNRASIQGEADLLDAHDRAMDIIDVAVPTGRLESETLVLKGVLSNHIMSDVSGASIGNRADEVAMHLRRYSTGSQGANKSEEFLRGVLGEEADLLPMLRGMDPTTSGRGPTVTTDVLDRRFGDQFSTMLPQRVIGNDSLIEARHGSTELMEATMETLDRNAVGTLSGSDRAMMRSNLEAYIIGAVEHPMTRSSQTLMDRFNLLIDLNILARQGGENQLRLLRQIVQRTNR